jgi:hypothetical protein
VRDQRRVSRAPACSWMLRARSVISSVLKLSTNDSVIASTLLRVKVKGLGRVDITVFAEALVGEFGLLGEPPFGEARGLASCDR